HGEVCSSLVEFVDLYPTVADYCGLHTSGKLAGQSLRPLLEAPSRPGKQAAFTLVTRGGKKYGQAVRTPRSRYIRWSDGNQELYAETNDPQEVHDLSDDPAKAETIEVLQELLAEVG